MRYVLLGNFIIVKPSQSTVTQTQMVQPTTHLSYVV